LRIKNNTYNKWIIKGKGNNKKIIIKSFRLLENHPTTSINISILQKRKTLIIQNTHHLMAAWAQSPPLSLSQNPKPAPTFFIVGELDYIFQYLFIICWPKSCARCVSCDCCRSHSKIFRSSYNFERPTKWWYNLIKKFGNTHFFLLLSLLDKSLIFSMLCRPYNSPYSLYLSCWN
jgi:hypothetical protein